MKLRLIAVVALLATAEAGSANAQLATPAYNWTGCYVGIAGGGNWGSSQVFYEGQRSPFVGSAEANTINLSGGLFGGTVGCGFQVSSWVLGIENDISWTNKSGTGATIFPLPFNPLTTFQTKESWLDTFRARFGYVWDRWFFYGTAGGAVVGEDFVPCNPLVGCTNESKSVFGWSAGLGVEYTLWRALSLKLEYLHVDLGRETFPGTPLWSPHDVALTDEIFRVGVNYKFAGQ